MPFPTSSSTAPREIVKRRLARLPSAISDLDPSALASMLRAFRTWPVVKSSDEPHPDSAEHSWVTSTMCVTRARMRMLIRTDRVFRARLAASGEAWDDERLCAAFDAVIAALVHDEDGRSRELLALIRDLLPHVVRVELELWPQRRALGAA